jgi:hypothetical protein
VLVLFKLAALEGRFPPSWTDTWVSCTMANPHSAHVPRGTGV